MLTLTHRIIKSSHHCQEKVLSKFWEIVVCMIWSINLLELLSGFIKGNGGDKERKWSK